MHQIAVSILMSITVIDLLQIVQINKYQTASSMILDKALTVPVKGCAIQTSSSFASRRTIWS